MSLALNGCIIYHIPSEMYEEPFTVERGRAALTAILSALENQVAVFELCVCMYLGFFV